MVALSFGCIAHQVKFHLTRGNFIGLSVKTFHWKQINKQQQQMTACSATVLQHNAKNIQAVWVISKRLAFVLLWSSVYMSFVCACVFVMCASPHSHWEKLFPERCMLLWMRGLWEDWFLCNTIVRDVCPLQHPVAPSYWQLDHNMSSQK